MSLLLQSTIHILKTSSVLTNKSNDLSKPFIPRSNHLSKSVKTSQMTGICESRQIRNASIYNITNQALINLKNKLAKAKVEHLKTCKRT